MKLLLPAITLVVLTGCGSSQPEPTAQKKPVVQIAKIFDETHKFHKEGLVGAKVVENHLGGKEFMPGGNIAEYKKDGRAYQVFFTLQQDSQKAMFLFMDYKDLLQEQKFIATFGGYFGMDGDVPTMIFQKEKYIVVITGLELKDADLAGRFIAGNLN